MGKIVNKRLNEDDKEEGLFERLNNIEDKNEDQSKKQLDAIENIDISSKPLKEISFFSTLSDEAKNLMINIKKIDDWLDKAQLICTKSDGKTKYDFSKFTFPKKIASRIYNKDFTLQEVEDDQTKIKILINKLNNDCRPTSKIKNKEKKDTLKSAEKSFSIKEKIIRAFKRGTFPYKDGIKVDEESDEESDAKSEEESEKESEKESEELEENKISKYIENESESINYELFEKLFSFVVPSDLPRKLFETKGKKKNSKLVKEIKNRWSSLKDEIKKMSKNEIKIEKLNKLLKIVEKIIEFNKKFFKKIRARIKNTNSKPKT